MASNKMKRHDAKVAEAPFVMPSEEHVVAALGPELEARFGSTAKVSNFETKRLQKTVYRYRLTIQTAEGSEVFPVIGKVRRGEANAAATLLSMEGLIESGFGPDSKDQIGVPRPFAVAGAVVLMEFVPGETARKLFRERSDVEFGRKLARGLAKLHGIAATGGLDTGLDRRVEYRRRAWEQIAVERPDLGAQVDMVDKVAAQLRQLWGVVPLASRHGDFHWGQMLCAEDGTNYLLDVTPGLAGDPAIDVANFLAQLEKHRQEPWFASFREAFLDEYLGRAGGGLLPRIYTYQALFLLTFAAKYIGEEPDEKHLSLDEMVDSACELVLHAKALLREQRSR